MLRELLIRDILLIDGLDLSFQPGLNVLTGETGAGKSILLDSLGFALGWRGRADVVRQGAEKGEVTAIFDLAEDHPARAVLEEADFPIGDELILRRTATPDGRKKGFVNDRRASGEVLRALSDTLVELHGQQDDRGLLNERGHRLLLDSFAGIDLGPVRAAWAARRKAATALAEAREAAARAAEDADFVAHAARELEDMDPQPGEDATLDARRRLLQASEKIRDEITRAATALGREGAQGNVADAMRWLDGVAEQAEGRLGDVLDTLSRGLTELAEAERGLDDVMRAVTGDPMELELVEERLFALRALARKHQVQPDDLPGLAMRFASQLAAITDGDAALSALEAELATAEAAYDSAADAIRAARHKAGGRLDKAVAGELAPLKMERAVFATLLGEAEPGPDGRDAVAFQVATNPGAPAGPLARIASGGELSRFLLALKVCLKGQADKVMIFDEIDRGVGGATADAVGRRLSGLATQSQLLVVTHSPQVAAQGQHHWRVSKSVEGRETRTRVAPLDSEARIAEIARMLSGETVTDAAMSAAEALLAG